MAGRAITISGRKYAAELFWQPAGGRGNPRENAAKIAKITRTRASLFVSFGPMIGLTGTKGGVRAGMPVAAAEAADALGESNFLAAFSVREGYWLLAVRGGIIVKDAVFPDADGAAREYMELNAMPDWGVLIAPENWNAPGASERRVADVISGIRKYRLANISNLQGYVMTLIVLCAAGFAGYKFFEEPIKKMMAPKPEQLDVDPEIVVEYKKKLEEIDAPKPKPAPKRVAVTMPWDDLPSPADKADQCWRAIAFLSMPITGWVTESATCVDGEATAHLLRTHGTIGDLYDEVRNKMPGVVIGETGGSDVVLTAKLRPLAGSGRAPRHSADEIMTAVQSVFQRINGDVDFRRDFVELDIPHLGEGEVPDTDASDVPVVKIDSVSKLQPREFIKIMGDVDGVRIPMIRWDNRNRNWIYEVTIFVR